MRKTFPLLLFILCTHVCSDYEMELQQSLPNDIIAHHIIKKIMAPPLMIKEMRQQADTIMGLRCNKYFNTIITTHIAPWLGLNKKNIDDFLINSTCENIPYFIRTSFKHGANPNFISIHRNTALKHAILDHNYPACKFLLERGADVNLELPDGYGNTGLCYPIEIVMWYRRLKLFPLFVEKGAYLDKKMSNYSLLTVAAESSDSDALELLLNAPSHNNHQKRWSLDDIQNAIFTIPTQHGPQRRKCLNLLSDATFDTMRHTAPPASTVLIVFTSLFMERLLSYVY